MIKKINLPGIVGALYQSGDTTKLEEKERKELATQLQGVLNLQRKRDEILSTVEWYCHINISNYWDRVKNKSQIMVVVERVVEFISNGKNVLVHCNQGLNRSVFLCVLILKRLGYSTEEAIERLESSGVKTNRMYEINKKVFDNESKEGIFKYE